jgi:hypothetical protein
MKTAITCLTTVALLILASSCGVISNRVKKDIIYHDSLEIDMSENGLELMIYFEKGEEYNHPTFVFWIEDMDENYIQTLFVTKAFATGIFEHGPLNDTLWGTAPGVATRPAALPYWWHKCDRGSIESMVPTPDNPFVDAYTGATPQGNFALRIKTDKVDTGKFRLLMEINQTWDWNEYWTNNKFPGDYAYKSSSQPSLIYSVTIDPSSTVKEYHLNPIGHGHYSGKDGLLYTDLSTITTALKIVSDVTVRILN